MSAQASRVFAPDFTPDSAPQEIRVREHEAGGAVGDLHRMLADRLAAGPDTSSLVAVAVPLDERLIGLCSRLVGYAALAAGIAATAWLFI